MWKYECCRLGKCPHFLQRLWTVIANSKKIRCTSIAGRLIITNSILKGRKYTCLTNLSPCFLHLHDRCNGSEFCFSERYVRASLTKIRFWIHFQKKVVAVNFGNTSHLFLFLHNSSYYRCLLFTCDRSNWVSKTQFIPCFCCCSSHPQALDQIEAKPYFFKL